MEKAGKSLGITTTVRSGQNGEYTAVIYSKEAQQFILDNLDAIAAMNAAPLHENQGKPWIHEEDTRLRQAFQTGSDVKEMSAALKRPRAEIRARMERLGLRWEEL